MRLKDKCMIVTGSTSGVGESIARRCVAEGARVLIHGKEPELGARLSAELGSACAVCIDDLIDPDALQRNVAAATQAFGGRIDGLVNNAASIKRSNLETTDAALFDAVMAVNLRAPLLMICAAREYLRQSRGAVLNIGSINGYGDEPRQLAYAISKAGLHILSRNLGDTLALEVIRVNHFVLGCVITENGKKLKVSEGLPPGWWENPPNEFVPSGKMTLPSDVAAAVFRLSDEIRPFSRNTIELEQFPPLGRIPPEGRPVKLRLAAFPKAYMDALCVDGSMTLRRWVELSAGLEVDGLEFYTGFLDLPDAAVAVPYRRMEKDHGRSIPMFCCSPDFTHPDAAFRCGQVDAERRWIDTALALGCGFCRVPSGQRRPEVSRADGIACAAGCIEACLPHAAAASVTLILENH